MPRIRGFSLIELMIVLAIITIIASIAVPSYMNQVRKSKRTDAMSALLKMKMEEEIWRSDHPSYTSEMGTAGLNLPTTTEGGYYTLSIPEATAYAFTLKATAVGDQANDGVGGQTCKILTIDQNNNKSPDVCWIK